MIGIFDSGVGGLSVFKEIYNQLPDNKYIYVSDNGYCPYGPRPREEVISRAVSITDYLISKGAKLIVVACNTATAAAIEYLRENYSIPFVGMEPAIKPAAIHSKSAVVGVLATKGTFKGELYLKTSSKFASNVQVLEQVGEGLVELVENGEVHSPQAYSLLTKYLEPMLEKGADHIVLGCTHYPFLTDVIKDIVGERMQIINPAPAIAKRVEEILLQEKICDTTDTSNTFVTTGTNIALIQKMVGDISPALLKEAKFDTIVL
ncbi:MAG: glutamate racemase [Bacteroidia bacterium]|nr:glutamate racemase [Bacteroidia bacterium]